MIARGSSEAHATVCPSFAGWQCRFCGLRGMTRVELVAHVTNHHDFEHVRAIGRTEGAAGAAGAAAAGDEDPAAAKTDVASLEPFFVTYRHWESTTNQGAHYLKDGFNHNVPGDPRNRGWHSFRFFAPVRPTKGATKVSDHSARAPFYAWSRQEDVPRVAGYKPLEICINASRDNRKFYWSQFWSEARRTGEYFGWHTVRVIWVLKREDE